eukprot:jgi/Picsp_1/1533/NSC_05011-R1_thioredoxin-like 1-2
MMSTTVLALGPKARRWLEGPLLGVGGTSVEGQRSEYQRVRNKIPFISYSSKRSEAETVQTTGGKTKGRLEKISEETKSNVLSVAGGPPALRSHESRQAIENEVQKLLEKENAWYRSEAPPNVVHVKSEKHLKSLVMSERDIVIDFFSPGCLGCKAMWPKVKKLARQNPEIIFAKVNTTDEGLMQIAEGLKVQKLPWFLLFSSGEMVASLTANLSTFDVLRAEIASLKECAEPECNI